MTETLLAGLKVLEHAQFVSGPYCAKLLADLGAEVIKIEPPGAGDETRRREPFLDDVPHPERSGLFFYLNTSKLGITLNPNTVTGRKMFKELVKETDVLVEDSSPRVMKETGLDYESLKDINPRLVMTSITPFGQTGPYKDYKAYYLNTYNGSGLAKILSDVLPDDLKQPLKGAGYLGDYDCGLSAAVATMGALYARLFTGMGQQIDISNSQLTFLALEMRRDGVECCDYFTLCEQGQLYEHVARHSGTTRAKVKKAITQRALFSPNDAPCQRSKIMRTFARLFPEVVSYLRQAKD